jgi:dTDP-4-dehydrorhamnose 3,5-epimerase
MIEPILINIKKYSDSRGFFYESYKKSYLQEKIKLDINFVQDNHSVSYKNVIRGLHYQWDEPMIKLVRVSYGSILDVLVDIRKNSNSFGKIHYYELNSENNDQLFVPAGFAHGFVCLSEYAHVQYKCSVEYNKNGESGINPFDKDLNIDWKINLADAIVSDKDINSKSFKEYCLEPKFKE